MSRNAYCACVAHELGVGPCHRTDYNDGDQVGSRFDGFPSNEFRGPGSAVGEEMC